MNLIAIHSNKIMAYLILRRFPIRNMENDFKNNRKVYCFEDTQVLREAMTHFNNDKDFHSTVKRIGGSYSSSDSTGF